MSDYAAISQVFMQTDRELWLLTARSGDEHQPPDYLRRLQEGFSQWSDVAVLMGRLVDCPAGASRPEAARILATPDASGTSNGDYRDGGAALARGQRCSSRGVARFREGHWRSLVLVSRT